MSAASERLWRQFCSPCISQQDLFWGSGTDLLPRRGGGASTTQHYIITPYIMIAGTLEDVGARHGVDGADGAGGQPAAGGQPLPPRPPERGGAVRTERPEFPNGLGGAVSCGHVSSEAPLPPAAGISTSCTSPALSRRPETLDVAVPWRRSKLVMSGLAPWVILVGVMGAVGCVLEGVPGERGLSIDGLAAATLELAVVARLILAVVARLKLAVDARLELAAAGCAEGQVAVLGRGGARTAPDALRPPAGPTRRRPRGALAGGARTTTRWGAVAGSGCP